MRLLHFGIITPPVSGHIHPFGALGRELIERGHRVTLLQMEDVRQRAAAEGLEFSPVGQSDHPASSLPKSLAALGKLDGLAALRFTIKAVHKTTAMFCRDAPDAVGAAGINCLLVDQTEPAGATVADYLGIPFITVCNALVLNREATVPPPFTSWSYSVAPWARLRNQMGYVASDRVMSSVSRVIAEYRRRWKLRRYGSPQDSFSPLAQISQLPAAFDYPRKHLPATFHYIGPFRKPYGAVVPFPWERLDGRPLVYASLGTLQNNREKTFGIFAEACAALPVQLVITHGGGMTDEASRALSGNPIVVPYAPQLDVLSRASLTLTHAGLNTVLDSLSQGVPLVAIPITYEQPSIAERIRWCGVGEIVRFKGLTASNLRQHIERTLTAANYKDNARICGDAICAGGGVSRAANIIESVCAR